MSWYSPLTYFTLGRVYARDLLRREGVLWRFRRRLVDLLLPPPDRTYIPGTWPRFDVPIRVLSLDVPHAALRYDVPPRALNVDVPIDGIRVP